ncbi:MAG TPA: NADH-quinone oxidoreductase subunit D [Aggregatilinea sp.]|nr:NADH-quinone oxidoreductase subunit D [Aggregatilinea sp.]HML22257.1 NADH-quinone oxidoreductase subunit D [Aggregatilinea sp.]
MSEQAPVVEHASPTDDALSHLEARFGDAIRRDEREGYDGLLVDPARLLDVARAVRDDLGYDYLSSATAVDYLDKGDHLEMVYHAYRTAGGPPLVFKAQTPRENAVLPSLCPVWPGADFQEREAWDLMGIRFEGHPNLKRILLWEGFAGHPLRKDWKEPYFEQENKPFDSRWPDGQVWRAEEHNPYGRNVQYPPGFTLEGYQPPAEEWFEEPIPGDMDVQRDLNSDRLIVSMGPQHPSTHGVFRMMVKLNGETIERLEPVMGYLHRNHEKIGERNTFIQNMPFTDRLDYLTSLSNNFGYAMGVEKLMALGARYSPPTRRAEAIRVLMAELTRLVSHFWSVGFLMNDLGAFFTPMMFAVEERELVLDFFEATTGSRMMCNYLRFGGVANDLPERLRSEASLINDRVRDFNTMEYLWEMIFERLPRAVDQFDEYLTTNEIVTNRCIGVGTLTREDAIAYSAAGPVLRASGVPYDVRRAEPYSIYPELEFDVAVRYHGDVYDRYLVRLDEMRQSLRILQQVYNILKATEGEPFFSGRGGMYSPRIPAGESYGRVENPKGELGYYVISDGGQNPWRYHVRAPSFINLTALERMCLGHKVADVVAILGSIDILLGEVDR